MGGAKEKALALRAFVFFKFFTRLNLRFRLVKNKKAPSYTRGFFFGGERGIRTPGPVTVNSFQDCRNRPLCQLSAAKVRAVFFLSKTYFITRLYLQTNFIWIERTGLIKSLFLEVS